MKALSAFWLPVVAAVVFAMPAGAAGFGGRGNALGGSFASRGASTRPLGGFPVASRPGFGYAGRSGRSGRGGYIYPYGYSFYIPDYFGEFDDEGAYGSYYGAPPAAPAAAYAVPAPAPPQQPVVINQYFGAQPLPQGNEPQQIADAQAAQGSVIGNPQNYYLIAYKNHAVYAALAYWVEDKTLHYVTTQNTHNQASLDLIDVTLTRSLNQSRDVPFTLPAQ